MLEKTMHYYLLAPLRREVLVAGKYLIGLLVAVIVFGGSVLASFFIIGRHFGPAWSDYIWNGPGLGHLGSYLLVATLACVGYGAVFLICGLWFRNPMIPAAVVMVWENLNPFLPTLLKKFSVLFYLKSLSPVQVPVPPPLSLIVIEADPSPAWIAIPGLLLVCLAILAWAGISGRKLEIGYSD
jgi:hypothetical protein